MRVFCLICLILTSIFSFAAPLKNIVVFGDSLSDNGNLYEYMHHQLPESPPYYAGRFSNGPIWAEDLAQSYFEQNASTHLLDYAFGGAGVVNNPSDDDDDVLFTLNREIDTYLLAHNGQADADSLFVVWIGGNNYLGLPDDQEETVSDVINGIEKGVKRIIQAGGKHILIINMPDIGVTPLARELEAPEAFTRYSDLHNQRLAASVQTLRQAYPQVQWVYFDAHADFKETLKNADQYGFNNVHDTCYDAMVKAPSSQLVFKIASSLQRRSDIDPEACAQYFFFDLLHPTQQVHAIMAGHIRQALDKEQVTFSAG